jgi:hypothetical protein
MTTSGVDDEKIISETGRVKRAATDPVSWNQGRHP